MEPQEKPARVVVTDLDINFGTLIVLMLKIAFAAIPAAIVFGVFVMLLPYLFTPI